VLTSQEGGESEPGVLRTLPFMRPTKAHSLRAPLFTLAAVRAARRALDPAGICNPGSLLGYRGNAFVATSGARPPADLGSAAEVGGDALSTGEEA